MIVRVGCLWLLAAVAACVQSRNQAQPHVALAAPKPDASIQERLDAYERLSSEQYKVTTISVVTGYSSAGYSYGQPKVKSKTFVDFRLSDNTTVHYSEDLLPVVLPTSTTAQEANKEKFYKKRLHSLSVATAVSGLALLASGALALDEPKISDDVIIGVAGVTFISILVAAEVVTIRKEVARNTAFLTYDRSLQEYLNLCKSKKKLIGCEEKALQAQPQSTTTQPENQ